MEGVHTTLFILQAKPSLEELRGLLKVTATTIRIRTQDPKVQLSALPRTPFPLLTDWHKCWCGAHCVAWRFWLISQTDLAPAFQELAIQFGLTFPRGPHFRSPLPPLSIQIWNHIASACKSSLVGTRKKLQGEGKSQSLSLKSQSNRAKATETLLLGLLPGVQLQYFHGQPWPPHTTFGFSIGWPYKVSSTPG